MSASPQIRYIAETVSPIGSDRHPMPQPEPLLPADIKMISRSIEISDYTKDGVDTAITSRYWTCVDELIGAGAKRITLAGFPIASQLGRPRVLKLAEDTEKKTGVKADSHAEASIAALKHFGAKRVTVASRWSDQLNRELAAYLQQADIEVLAVTGVGQ